MSKTERLIEMVRSYPMLYDLSHEDYKSLRKKDRIWSEIGKELDENGEEVKKKWKNLRDTYAKYIKCTRREAAQSRKSTRKWLWAEQMKVFRPYLTFAKISPNICVIDSVNSVSKELSPESGMESGDNLEIKNIQSKHSENSFIEDIPDTEYQGPYLQVRTDIQATHPSQLPASYATPTIKVPTEQKTGKKRHSEPSSSVREIIKCFENQKETEYDATDYLLLAHAKTIKTFSGRRQAITKMRIAQVIMEQEILHQEELTSTISLSRPESANSNHSNSSHSNFQCDQAY